MDTHNQALDEERCWQAVARRDTACDGQFVYAVRSTGIYCRPGCPSRRPGRAQVVFFASTAQAAAAGFRPCRRCQPDAASAPAAALAGQAARLIEAAVAEGRAPTLAWLGAQLHTSPAHLQRTFKAAAGLTPRQYAAALRASQLKEHLRDGQPVTDALYQAGYGSSSRVYASSDALLGMPPGTYRRGGSGVQIRYTIFETRLGWLLLAATTRGVCSLQFGEVPAALEAALAAEFPRAERQRGDAALAGWADALRAHLEQARPELALPLDVTGTAFQQRVWAMLRSIPYGETRTYTQVAEALGQPTAARAVARACATNPAALVIPCHRVVRAGGRDAGGNLAGYRWGLARKQALLAAERKKPG